MTLFTVNRATNAEMMKRILAFYKPPPAKILDSTYGYGSFWKGFQSHTFDGDYELTTMDIRPLPGVSQVADYTKPLPFPDSSFDVIVYDPPFGGWDYTESMRKGFDYGYNSGKSESNDQLCMGRDSNGRLHESDGKLSLETAKAFYQTMKRDGIVVYKHTHRQEIPSLFDLHDYLLQDLGAQPQVFPNPRARVNHATWMILRKVLK